MAKEVPIVDFLAYSLDRECPDPETIQRLVDDVHHALTTLGFMYLKNYGIPTRNVEKVFDVSRQFFNLNLSDKNKCASSKEIIHGFRGLETESLNPERKSKDLKEAFSYYPNTLSMPLPDKDVPDFGNSFKNLFHDTVSLMNRVLQVIAMALQLEDTNYFANRNKFTGTSRNLTNLTSFYYPELTNRVVKGDQVRCGEHTDFCSVTLLFQDPQGGLEVMTKQGQWIQAPPIPGTVMVNIGDLMQRWTADELIACKHRVMLPTDEKLRGQARQSLALFANLDNDALVECLDGSNKYRPITAYDYLQMKFASMIQHN